MTKRQLSFSFLLLLILLSLSACGDVARPSSDGAFMATLDAEAAGIQPTIQQAAATRSALQTQSAAPTATVTPMAQLLTGGDELDTTLIWNITDFGLGAGGGIHELRTTAEAHHFLFAGSAGAEANIYVNSASSGSLPRFILLDPSGSVIGQAAAQGPAQGAEITLMLPIDGTYHIRVSALAPGNYALGMTIQP